MEGEEYMNRKSRKQRGREAERQRGREAEISILVTITEHSNRE